MTDEAKERSTRRNPEMEKYVEVRPSVMEDFPDAHSVILTVANQQFVIGRFASETKAEAEWMRDMLCVALAKIVRDGVEIECKRCADIVQAAREGDADTDLRSIISCIQRGA